MILSFSILFSLLILIILFIILFFLFPQFFHNLFIQPQQLPQTPRTDIICNIKFNTESNESSFSCSNPEYNPPSFPTKNINIVSDKIIKISFSKETNSFGKDQFYYYFVVPYVFTVDFFVDLNLKNIIINSLDELLIALDNVDSKFNQQLIDKNIQDKCLNLTRLARGESKPPYNVTCIFFPGGFTTIKSLSDLMNKSFLPALNTTVQLDYFNYILNKIQTTNTLSIFEYIIYLSLLNSLKLKNYNYVAQCKAPRQIFC